MNDDLHLLVTLYAASPSGTGDGLVRFAMKIEHGLNRFGEFLREHDHDIRSRLPTSYYKYPIVAVERIDGIIVG